MSRSLPGWSLAYQGKVRDIYIPETESNSADSPVLLIVASDRVSAHDVILQPDVPAKGELLTQISEWWMGQFADVRNHLLAASPPTEVEGRAVVAQALDMLPVECVVRGYLAGSAWKEYRESGSVCGHALPPGLHEGDALPEPLFTPATKAAVGDHDENIPFDRVVDIVGMERAVELRDTSIDIYRRASEIAQVRGLILADTKFEFGLDKATGDLVWGDEALTPDSSRYWDLENYRAGGSERLASFDKQPVRDWLKAHWEGKGTPPEVPAQVVADTASRYRELRDRLMGNGQ
jgi:phosphoribosylaminoimidazole-succinocarboxamide synthase